MRSKGTEIRFPEALCPAERCLFTSGAIGQVPVRHSGDKDVHPSGARCSRKGAGKCAQSHVLYCGTAARPNSRVVHSGVVNPVL